MKNWLCFNRPKAISCLATRIPDPAPSHGLEVSIARRRLVVLRRVGGAILLLSPDRFNRPKAISCLATGTSPAELFLCHLVSIARRRLVVLRLWLLTPKRKRASFVSIARRRLVVLRHGQRQFALERAGFVSIARRRLVVLRLVLLFIVLIPGMISFNRPKAISCLATDAELAFSTTLVLVSIARRRLVVLRLR